MGATTGNPPYVVTSMLKSVQMPIISNIDANNLNGSSINVTSNMLAFYQSGSGAAPGDSGGPAIINVNNKPILIGASSWGLLPKDQKPTIYTRIKNYANWINLNTGVNFSHYSVSGPSQFCTTTTYQIPNLPSGATVTWNATGSISISGSNTANPVNMSKSIDGTGALTATVNTACGSFNLSKMINVGAPTLGMPSFTNLDNQNPYWCSNNSGNSFTIESNDLSSTYEARLLAYPSLNVYATNSNAYPGFDVFGYVPPGYYVFQLRATNACGTSAWVETEVESVYCTSDWESNNLNVYPNPAKETLTITYENTEGMQAFELSKTASEEKHLLLFDDKGKEVKKDMMKAGDTKLEWDIKNLPSGRYFLHIKEDKEVIKKQIIIKH
ncbi:trypsin-like serine protease [Pedobacter aquae]|uniref:Trypsin-like serine protease n=1 Tax=Pedobacter aquae TaxID=2605747 RepID=A0A5C0VP99_9SPHI|nr:T9SS type A sorting domain-containing protein [Pedobacter aquae]QEK52744.1 trypsin-like serine protease [Pedobacter aquae]